MRYKDNPKINAKYHSQRWLKVRKYKKMLNPICERCEKKGIITPAYIIHHKEYINDLNYEDDEVFYNIDNLESVCQDCHNKEHFGEQNEYIFDEEGNCIKNA